MKQNSIFMKQLPKKEKVEIETTLLPRTARVARKAQATAQQREHNHVRAIHRSSHISLPGAIGRQRNELKSLRFTGRALLRRCWHHFAPRGLPPSPCRKRAHVQWLRLTSGLSPRSLITFNRSPCISRQSSWQQTSETSSSLPATLKAKEASKKKKLA